VSIAGATVPQSDRAAGWNGSPRNAADAARDALRAARVAGVPSDEILPGHPIKAVCAITYAGPAEIGRVLAAARHPGRGAVTANAPATIDRPTGRIRVEVKHRMRSGRLVVLVDGKTVLSKPFDVPRGKSGTVTHVLSVPAGEHGIEVRLLADKGGIAAKSKITGTVKRSELALLTGEQRSASRKKLELDWHASPRWRTP